MPDDHDAAAIVIGSGFGGAVAAARLAQAGYAVIVLERGRRWHLGDFPRDPKLKGGWLWQVDRGLYDVRWLEGMLAVQAAGWGGGSLAYANVFARPSDTTLDSRWPTHLRRAELDPYYDLAAYMLDVSPVADDPRTGSAPPRTSLVEEMMADLPEGTVRPNLAVTFGDPNTWRTNKHGVPRRGCAFVGECVVGCNHGAKNSLDTNYLHVAERHGARSVPDAEVIRIAPEQDGYVVTTRSPSDPAAALQTWRAARVFLAAGAVATTELLLRSRDVDRTLPHLSQRLGDGFSGNGDFLTLAALRKPRGDMTTGPTITTTTILDVPEGRRSVWYQVQDGAVPVALQELIDTLVPGQRLRSWWRRLFPQSDPRSTFAVLAMGHDSAEGTLRLDRSGGAVLRWRNRWQSYLYRSQRRVGPLVARLMDARIHNPITWSLFRKTTTVHPLGGVPSGADAEAGVVDEIGEVHGHPGLFVIDGSTLPASTGVNPSATILAAAERSIETVIRRERDTTWRAPEWSSVERTPVPEDSATAFSAELRAATSGGGIAFSERMVTRQSERPRVTLRLTVETASIDRFLADPDHILNIKGTVDIDDIASAAAVAGTLSLFPAGRREAMAYELSFHNSVGEEWRLSGAKSITGRRPWRLVSDLTRLDASARAVPSPTAVPTTSATASGATCVAAELHISPPDLMRLTGSLRGTGFTRPRRARTVVRFVSFFARSAIKRVLQPAVVGAPRAKPPGR